VVKHAEHDQRDGYRLGGGRGVGDDESGGWLVMEIKLLLEEVLCKR
jgi:hypothetical protein